MNYAELLAERDRLIEHMRRASTAAIIEGIKRTEECIRLREEIARLRANVDHIVMVGNPVDGFKFHGPFSHNDAYKMFHRLDDAEDDVTAVWVVPLEPTK